MSTCSKFIQYAMAFEQAAATDQWSLLEPLFADDALHVVNDGGPFAGTDRGPAAVVAGLRRVVHGIDRRFDARIPEIIEGPELRGDGVWMRFRLRLRRAGLPDFLVDGEHLTVHRGGKIVEFHETLAPGHGERATAYLQQHDAALLPAGLPYRAPSCERDLKDIEISLKAIFVRCYGMAKGNGDIAAALSICHPDFGIDAVPFRMASRNRNETAQQLGLFFHAFPDFSPAIEGLVTDANGAACWGTVRMTHGGDFLGIPASGKTATLPFFSAFEFKGGLLLRERFFIDLAMLCGQTGLPLQQVLPVLEMLSAQTAAAA